MIENKEELQLQVSELIHQDIVKIVTSYSQTSLLKLDDVISFVQDVNLLNIYDVEYIHNDELNEIIDILNKELKVRNTQNMTLLITFDYLLKKENNYKQALYVNLFGKIEHEEFMNAFAVFAVLNSTVKDLFSDFMIYIFNDDFLDLKEEVQIDYIYKAWNFSQQIFHDNEASQFAYTQLKILFDKALEKEKTEVAFWLYYTPMHYFHSGTDSDINKVNEKFKIEIEKPLEQYIQKKLIPKYDIKPNTKTIDKSKKIKVAFVMQRIIRHSTVNVFYSLVKSLMKNRRKEYEFIVYDFSFSEAGGSDVSYIEEFKNLGIKYINLHTKIFGNMVPTYSLVEKCLKTREILINDDIDIFIGLHTRVEYIFLYATRTTAKQIYWYHSSNVQYDIDGIDKKIGHGETAENIEKFNIAMDIDKFHNVKIKSDLILEERNKYPKNVVILGTIGRLVKISDDYLDVIVKIMNVNLNTIYIAAGGGDIEKLSKKIDELGLSDRFYFPGYVNPHVYGNIIDFFPDTFPINQGESLQEFIYKKNDNAYVTLKSKVFMNYHKKKHSEEERNIASELDKIDQIFHKYNNYIIKQYYENFTSVVDDLDLYIKLCNFYINDKELRIASNYLHRAYMNFLNKNAVKQFISIMDKI